MTTNPDYLKRSGQGIGEGTEVRSFADLPDENARLRAALKAEIDRNTPLEARMRKALEEIRSFVCVPLDGPDYDMAAQLNAGSVIRMTRIARVALGGPADVVEASKNLRNALSESTP